MPKPVDARPARSAKAVEADAQRPVELEVPLPARLAAFGQKARASLCGPDNAPVVVMLGGISADRYPCVRPDGTAGWWAGLACRGRAVDPARYRVVGIEFAADESGEFAPSTQEQAAVVEAVLQAVGGGSAHAVVGASYGGMAALALAEHFPRQVERLVIVSAPAEPHPASSAIRELQRRTVALALAGNRGEEGLSIARGLAMMTYRTPAEFARRFRGGIDAPEVLSVSEPGAYLRARGNAFPAAMSPKRFLSLSASIDRHRVDPAEIRTPTLLIGAQSDQLVPPAQMAALAAELAGPTELHLLPSFFGHDMFLKNADELSKIVAPFLESRKS